METSLYISNEKLIAARGQAAGSRIAVKAVAEAPLPAGSVLGGVITDEAAFSTALTQLANGFPGKLKGVRLVFNSSQFYVKRVTMPKLPKKKLLGLVQDEFTDISGDDGGELIYDCMTLRDSTAAKGNTVLACAARQSLIASYATLFAAAGIKLSGIDTTHAALIKLADRLFAPDSTFIVLALDGSMLDATLFVNNCYRFNNRVRLMSERGTAEGVAEVSRMVSSIIQFNTSERSGQSIGNVYVVGARESELPLLDSLATAYDIPAAMLSDTRGAVSMPEGALALSECAFAVGNLVI